LRNQSITNFIAHCPAPVFFKAKYNTEKVKDSKVIANDIVKAIEEIPVREDGTCKVAAVVTDNAAVMKKAWKLAGDKCGGVYFIGCFCHAMNLFFNDIFAKCHDKMEDSIFDEDVVGNDSIVTLGGDNDWTIQLSADAPEDDILAEEEEEETETNENIATSGKIKKISDKWAAITVGSYSLPQMYFLAMQITTFVRAHCYGRQALLDAMKTVGIAPRQLQLAGLTRWGSIVLCLYLVLYAKPAFAIWIEDPHIKKLFKSKNQKKLLSVLQDVEFFNVAKIICDALIPLCVLIAILEGDYATIAFGWHQLVLYEKYLLTTRFATAFPAAVTFYRSRKLFLYSDVVGLANLLDPRYRGADLTHEQKKDARQFLIDNTPEEHQDSVINAFGEFLKRDSKASKRFTPKLVADPVRWWTGTGNFYYKEISEVASKLLSIICNSASSERIWSKFTLIHSKIRNRLAAKKTIVLCVIYAYLRMKYSCAQRRPKLKDDFVLAQFEANHPIDPFVVQNIDTVVGEDNVADLDALEAELDSMMENPEMLEVSIRSIIKNGNLEVTEPAIYQAVVEILSTSEDADSARETAVIIPESDKELNCICQRLGCQNYWSGPCFEVCGGKLCYCEDCMDTHECIVPKNNVEYL
jgi:hypothetical protein